MGTAELPSEKSFEDGDVPEDVPAPQPALQPHNTTTTPASSPASSPASPPATATSWLWRQIKGPGRRAPTTRMSAGQAAYIFGFHGVGSLVISGGVNFGIACAMYLSPSDPIALLRLPNTLAGDAALTIIIQTIVTWLIEWAVLTSDLSAGKIAPLSFRPSNPRVRRLLGVPDHPPSSGNETRSPRDDAEARDSSSNHKHHRKDHRLERLPLPSHVPRILALLIPSFILFWPPSLAILTTVGTKVGNDYVFPSRWAPQIFKLVLGGTLGLLITPLMALFWVMREGLAS